MQEYNNKKAIMYLEERIENMESRYRNREYM